MRSLQGFLWGLGFCLTRRNRARHLFRLGLRGTKLDELRILLQKLDINAWRRSLQDVAPANGHLEVSSARGQE
jgi:hypothetical protein